MTARIHATKLAKVLLSGAALSAIATPVLAQSIADEIIVSATKREQTLQEVPIAVSVVDADVIEKAQIIDLIDLSNSVSSLRVTQLQNSSQTNFVIRGFGNGANNPGIESSVGVFIDGVFRSRSASAILDLPTLERVEVLRGPQSTLFGKNVSVGAISISTKKPSFDWEGTVEATYGNIGQVRFRGSLSGPLSDTVAFRVSGSTNNRNGTYTNLVTGNDNINERDRWAARAQLLWEPTDTLSFRAIGDINRIDEVCCGAVQLDNSGSLLIAAPPPIGLGEIIAPAQDPGIREVAVDQEPTNRLEGMGISVQGDWDLGFGQITSITSYREQSDFNNTDVDFSGADIAVQPQELDLQTFTQELRIAGETDTDFGTFNWIAGGFLFNEDVSFRQSTTNGSQVRGFVDAILMQMGTGFGQIEGTSQLVQGLVAGPTAFFPEFNTLDGAAALPFGASFASGTGFSGDYSLDNRSYSLFAQVDWELTDRLTLTGGISYVNDRKEAIGNVVNTEQFQNFDLSQFNTTGGALVAANILGGLIGTPFDPTNPTPFFVAAQTLAATDPMAFAAARGGAVAAAQGALAADPTLNPLLPFTGLTALQFVPIQVSFPQPGAVRDGDISLSDDGFTTDNDFNYTARLAYDVLDNLNVYFSYATGFKASAINLSQDAVPPFVGTSGAILGRFAGPEEVRTFEVGAKASFDGGFINVALFDQVVNGFQSNTFLGTGFALSNAGSQSVRGFEVDAAYSPVDPLNFTFGLTYLDPEYDSFVDAACQVFVPECAPGQATFDASGERPSGVHPVSITTSGSYTKQMANGAELSFRGEYFFASSVDLFDFAPPGVPQRRTSTVNGNISYNLENGFGVNIWARNLLDNASFVSAFPTPIQAGSTSAYVVQPRTFGISLRKDW